MHQRQKRSLFRRLNVSFVTLNDDDDAEVEDDGGQP
jgi:hypothetical protein